MNLRYKAVTEASHVKWNIVLLATVKQCTLKEYSSIYKKVTKTFFQDISQDLEK